MTTSIGHGLFKMK